MKTVLTIVLDEDKKRYGWRVDRNESDEVLKELYGLLLKDDKYCHNDSLENDEPIADWFIPCLEKQILPEVREQYAKYQLHNEAEGTIEVL